MSGRSHAGALAVLAFIVALPAASHAQSIYTCRDRSGRTLTSDQSIAECAGVMRELGPSGIVRREIAPPLTAEQQRQKDLDDKARRIAEEAAREKRRRDMALLASYQSEDQIEAARKRALADANESIQTSRARLDELTKEKSLLVHEADGYKGKPVPPLLRRKVDDTQALIDDEEAAVKMRQADVERVNQRYDDDRDRFRALNGASRGATR